MGDNLPRRKAKWGDFGRRVASAAILAPVALLCIWFGGAAFDALILVGALGLSVEWATLCGAQAGRAPGLFVPGFVVLGCAVCILLQVQGALEILVVGAILLWATTRRGMLAAGVLYAGLPLVCLLWLRQAADGRMAVLFIVLVVWASDSGAYLVGRLVGGPKLAPRLSPGKTWSGALGGLVSALLVGVFVPGGTPALAVVLGIVCQAGDLLESAIKRHVGVKDSGWLIPGHGGLLDRLDGLLAAAPVAALAMLIGRGGFR